MPTSTTFYGDEPWTRWVTSTTMATTGTNIIWSSWCDNNSAATTTTNSVWVQWIDTATVNTRVLAPQEVAQVRPRVLTAEEVAEAEERARVHAEENKRTMERYRAAKERAEGFLYEHLTDEQRAQLKREKFFVVEGGKSKKRYRIKADGASIGGNVTELDQLGREVKRFCAHIEYAANAPPYDHYLAQKLMLEHCEEAFLKVANATNLR